MNKLKIIVILLSATSLNSASLHAQIQERSGNVPANEVQNDSIQLEEIVVTAQKRSENLQNVPIAVSVAKGEQLAALGIKDAVDLKIAVPTLNTVSTNGYLSSSIRGVGSIAVGPGVENPVAVYVDGVYIAAPQAATMQLNNIASVEVLKGPQGTLFGRNATGGLIQITTNTPTSETRAKFELGYSNYDAVSGSAYLSGPIASNVFADISFVGRQQNSGWGTNLNTGADVYRQKNYALRSKLIWEAGPDTKFTLIGDYTASSGSMGAFTDLPGKVPGWPLSALTPAGVNPDNGYNVSYDLSPRRFARGGGASVRIDQNIGSVKLASITAYRKSRVESFQDFDFTTASLADFTYTQPDRQFSQELQLSSDKSGPLKWTAGLYYYSSQSAYDNFILNLNFLGRSINTNNTQKARSMAGYVQATYELLADTNLTLGGRYTSDRREEKNASLAIVSGGTALPLVTVPGRHVTFNKFTYRASLDHRFSSGLLGYVSYNRGFKGGGYNSGNPGIAPYSPEVLDAMEAGLKADLLDKRLRVNLAAFDYKYKNIQVQKLFANGTIGTINGPKAHIYGIDADITAVLADGLTLGSGIGWISPKYGDFPGCSRGTPNGGVAITTVGTDCKGSLVAIAAKFVANAGLNYSADVAGGKLAASGNIYYNSGFYFEPDNIIKQGRHTQLGASVKWTSDNGLSVGAFGKNLTNKRVLSFGATQVNGNQVGMYAEPRTYGVTVGYEF
jgi:iron complex outermembrane recepter protein